MNLETDSLYTKTSCELMAVVKNRFIILIAKIAGFKSLCLILATILLVKKIIAQDIWLYVLITVICNNSGIRLAEKLNCNFTNK